MKRIDSIADLAAFARQQGLRHDWHEPDEQGITATVRGAAEDFDNAGFWPRDEHDRGELHVVFQRVDYDDADRRYIAEDLACVNLATLCAWASGTLKD